MQALPVRHPAARPARRRRGEGRAPRARRVGPRRRRPAMVDPEGRKVGATYLRNNLNKRSVGIDLKSPEGRELFLRARAAASTWSPRTSRPGTMDRMGLGYDAIAAAHPAAIYVSISGLRQHGRDARTATGPRTRRSSRRCRASTSTSRPRTSRRSTIPVGALGDISSALFARHRHPRRAAPPRRAPAQGQYVDIAMFDAMVAMTDIVTNFWSLGVRPEPGKAARGHLRGLPGVRRLVRRADRARAPVRNARRARRPPRVERRPALRDRAGLGPTPRDGDPPRGRGVGVDSAPKLEAAHELTAAGIAAGPEQHAPRRDRRPARRGAPHARRDAAHRRRRPSRCSCPATR